jgi:hypothetical protein
VILDAPPNGSCARVVISKKLNCLQIARWPVISSHPRKTIVLKSELANANPEST